MQQLWGWGLVGDASILLQYISLIASCIRRLNFKIWNVLPNNDTPNARMTLSDVSFSGGVSPSGGKIGGPIDQKGRRKRIINQEVSSNIQCTSSSFGFGFPG